MTTWKDGGPIGLRQKIANEDGRIICTVRTRQWEENGIEPWPEGEANFRLILNAPKMLKALEAIHDKTVRMMQERMSPSTWADWEAMRGKAIAAAVAVKGENDDDLG